MRNVNSNGRTARKATLLLIAAAAFAGTHVAATPGALGQQDASQAATVASRAEFDVASIKPISIPFNRPFDSLEQMGWKTNHRWSERVYARDAPLRGLIQMAYDVWPHQIEGLPRWTDTARYEIDARASGARFEQMRAMMRTLLADRFKLVLHRETRTLPVLELVRAEGGIKIAPMPPGGCVERSALKESFLPFPAPMPEICRAYGRVVVSPAPALVERVQAVGVEMSHLVNLLSAEVGRIVVDRTNFTDTFSYEVNFSASQPSVIPGAASGREPGSSVDLPQAPLFLQAVKEQLGLELKPSTAPVEVLVIDHIERPSPN